MSPERSSSPLSPQAVAPRMIAMEVDSVNVQEAESPSHQVAENGIQVAGESNGSTVPVTNDDDLTSLSWLQDRNLLKGMNLSKNETEETYIKSENGSVIQVSPPKEQQQQQQPPEYVLPDLSPTSDYVDESSTSAADSSSSSLNSPVPYTNNFTPRNKHPHNVPYDPKIHTTSKPPYSFSCLIFMAIENSEQKALPVKEIYAWILEHFPYFKNAPTGWKNSVRHNLSLNKCFQKVEKAPNLGKGSLWMVDQQYRPNLLQALNRSPFHPCTPLDPSTYLTPKGGAHDAPSNKQSQHHHRLPDPELFPYLSRRLAASSEGKHEASDDSLDDMDAANVMLALKHGPRILKERRRRSVKMNSPLDLVQVITTSPSEDHTYSAAKSHENASASPDEAFESDDESHYSKKYHYLPMDLEEQRKIEEGADALLNLAGISTLRKRTYSSSNCNSNINSSNNNNNNNNNNNTPSTMSSGGSSGASTSTVTEIGQQGAAAGSTPSAAGGGGGGGGGGGAATGKQPPRRRARRRATSASSDPAEQLTEMSVRGLNLFRYASVNEGVYQCTECAKVDIQKTFKNKYSFQRHAFLYHEGHQRKVFPCPVCGKEFSRPDKMKNHMKTVHDCFMPKDVVFPMGFFLPP